MTFQAYQDGQLIIGEAALPLMRKDLQAALRCLEEREVAPEFQTPEKTRERALAIQQTRRDLAAVRAEELRIFQARDLERKRARDAIWFSRSTGRKFA